MTALSVVILTRGDRPASLQAAIESIRQQAGVEAQIVVVANGCDLATMPGVEIVSTPQNVGIPAGRNIGWRSSSGDVVVFLDDDARAADPGLAAATLRAFAAEDDLGIISYRIDDEEGTVLRRHVPRLVVGDPRRSSEVTTFLGGACAIRRTVLEEVGGFPDDFFYAHEETDVAWAALDRGYRIRYAGDIVVIHPSEPISRHDRALWYTARNRVLLARRRLPLPLAAVYVMVRSLMSLPLVRRPGDLAALARGYAAGLTTPSGRPGKIRWSTALRMARLGRPPIV
jgi:GT2 family glycosyltransferase